jgi:hypothetical protein
MEESLPFPAAGEGRALWKAVRNPRKEQGDIACPLRARSDSSAGILDSESAVEDRPSPLIGDGQGGSRPPGNLPSQIALYN